MAPHLLPVTHTGLETTTMTDGAQFELLGSSHDTAKEILGPYEPIIRRAIERAWARWRGRPPEELLALNGRARAAMMWCFMKDEVTNALRAVGGVNTREHSGTCDYVVKNQILFRLKKLNRMGRSRNFPTPTSVAYYAQLEIEGMPRAIRLDIGYVLNPTRTAIREILVSCPLDGGVVWTYGLRADEGGQHVAAIVPQEGGGPPRVSRVRVARKSSDERKETGSGD